MIFLYKGDQVYTHLIMSGTIFCRRFY